MWPFAVDEDGYGKLPYYENGKKLKVSAHRLSYKLIHGRWPMPNGLHSCDTPGCFNPRHIFEGTAQDNHDDQVSKGRQLKGTQQADAKLTEEIVIQARQEYRETNLGFNRLAKKYGVSIPAMKTAIEGIHNWKHVPNPVGLLRPIKVRRQTHCKRGYLLTIESCYVSRGFFQCKQCKSDVAKEKRKSKEA